MTTENKLETLRAKFAEKKNNIAEMQKEMAYEIIEDYVEKERKTIKYRITKGKILDVVTKKGLKKDGTSWKKFEILIKAENNQKHTVHYFPADGEEFKDGDVVETVEYKQIADDVSKEEAKKIFYSTLSVEKIKE